MNHSIQSPAAMVGALARFLLRHATLSVFLLSLAACGLHAVRNGMPHPGTFDEFAYLLGAETLAEGRLSNAPHPLQHYFQTYQVLDNPTYASKFPLGPSAVLTLGMLLGHPILGLWLVVSAFCASLVWIARTFMTPGWSFSVGLAAIALHSGGGQWAQSYWSPALAALGGALLLGSVLRWVRAPRAASAIPGAVGIVLLVHSLPFEGAVFGAILATVVLVRAWRIRAEISVLPSLAVFALGLVLALGIQGAINQKVTGDWAKRPYSAYQEARDNNPVFLWSLREPAMEFEHDRLEFYDFEVMARRARYNTPVYLDWTGRFLAVAVQYGTWVGIPLLLGGLLLGLHRRRLLLAIMGGTLLSSLVVLSTTPHQQAPFAAALLILFALAFRRCLAFAKHLRGHLAPGIAVAIAMILVAGFTHEGTSETDQVRLIRETRRSLERHLTRQSGEHLVVVRYAPGVNPHVEYVFNGADIDAQKVIWARWSERRANDPLFDYFNKRRLWLVEVGVNQSTVREFSWNQGDVVPKNLSEPLKLDDSGS